MDSNRALILPLVRFLYLLCFNSWGNKTFSKLRSGLKSWSSVKSQKGAFKKLGNAKSCNLRFGLKVFYANRKIVFPVGRTIDQLAREVFRGIWGNWEKRNRRLTNACCDVWKFRRELMNFYNIGKHLCQVMVHVFLFIF